MSFVRTFNKKSNELFREQCYEPTNLGLYEQEMKEALGKVIIKCTNFFTADVQPVYTDQGLAYAISQYSSEEVILIRDDDYPDLELPDWCSSDLVPIGLRKAAALSEILHADNIKKYGIEEDEDPNKYTPILPYLVYLKSSGQRMTAIEFVSMYLRKFLDSNFFAELLSLLVHMLLYGIGGAVLAPFLDTHPIAALCGGALLGVAYWFIGFLNEYVFNTE